MQPTLFNFLWSLSFAVFHSFGIWYFANRHASVAAAFQALFLGWHLVILLRLEKKRRLAK